MNYKERDFLNKLNAMERELDDYKDENRKLRRDLDATRADCDQMIKLLDDNEAKI